MTNDKTPEYWQEIVNQMNDEKAVIVDESKGDVWASAPRCRLRDILLQLMAVETLEYHDKNWLAIDGKLRAERKQNAIKEALDLLGRYYLDK